MSEDLPSLLFEELYLKSLTKAHDMLACFVTTYFRYSLKSQKDLE